MSEQTATRNPQLPEDKVSDIRPLVTVEAGLYVAILLLGLAVRLYRLDLAPLSTGEAQLALAAWRGTAPPSGASLLLFWINSLVFAVLGSSDGLARLVPALVGSALVVTPAFWRERVGRAGALGASALLAVSPVAIMVSRTSSGEALVAAALVGLVVTVDRYMQTGRAAWLGAGAAILGAGLASGAGIYSALLALLIGAAAIAPGSADKAIERWRAIRGTPGLVGRVVAVLVAVFAASATGLMWRPGGLAAAIDLFSRWLAGPAQAGATAWHWPFQVLTVYEPLALILGPVGLLLALEHGGRFVRLLIAWLLVAMLLAVVRPARASGDVLLAVIPLAMLGGYALEALIGSLRAIRPGIEEGILVLVVLPVIAYLMLGLAAYVNIPPALPPLVERLGPLAQAIPMFLALALIGILVALFAALIGAEVALRGVILATLGVLAMATWAAGWGAAQSHPGDPRELIVGPEATAPAVHDLLHDLSVLSSSMTTDPHTLSFLVQSSPDDVLAWYLRDMPNAQFVSALDTSSAPQVLITTASQPPALAGSYAGERFTLRQEWRSQDRTTGETLKWLIYRKAEPPKPTVQAILWIQQGQ